MTPPWLSHLVRARQAQEDGANQRLAIARRAQSRAEETVRHEAARVDALATRTAQVDSVAFVAAAVALQAAAATHAAAVDAVGDADGWVVRRNNELITAATARHVAETLRDSAAADDAARALAGEQGALDEIAAVRHLARHREAAPASGEAGS